MVPKTPSPIRYYRIEHGYTTAGLALRRSDPDSDSEYDHGPESSVSRTSIATTSAGPVRRSTFEQRHTPGTEVRDGQVVGGRASERVTVEVEEEDMLVPGTLVLEGLRSESKEGSERGESRREGRSRERGARTGGPGGRRRRMKFQTREEAENADRDDGGERGEERRESRGQMVGSARALPSPSLTEEDKESEESEETVVQQSGYDRIVALRLEELEIARSIANSIAGGFRMLWRLGRRMLRARSEVDRER
ncbi:hypothetical protein M501DRAFT_1017520 [Patellaria atrata CBS 101060]|uniref:Uncharacterized protein n=1 Tax=Patellaria atrata CBS 101060 TaxID=1346257 RepID=A0A9P4S7W2_9PEZI|nr:hypothetical protein M501DRAFT_1017520 [Patellaria atrata CBS 101060]